jgi:superfamily II DNA or RNA helicase
MQIPQCDDPGALRAGDLVRVRRHRWRVADVRGYDHCRLVTLSGAGALNGGVQRRVLAPFDIIEPLDKPTVLRFVHSGRWRRACRALVAQHTPPGALRSPLRARIDLLPHQLEPAISLVRGLGSRVLLADDVGLGKTIQAGLAVAELRARGAAEKVLILTPAGLRDQWASELAGRFDLDAEIVDFRAVRNRVAALPVGLNPWSMAPIAIASIDYVKRPEILRAVMACRWDAIVIDEAHGVTGDSERHAAVAALAVRAAYVLLLTATPHSGDRRAFESLSGIGSHGDRLLVFRRTRQAMQLGPARKVHQLHVRPSAAELRMHALLAAFTHAVRRERGDRSREVWLALSVLHKRALSSPYSLEQSVARRLSALASTPDGGLHQLGLPLGDLDGETDRADAPPQWADAIALGDPSRERELLGRLAAAARAAAARETKVSALVRILDRAAEPAVVFTEYRDTLVHLEEALARPVALLHGGLTREERLAALDDFTSGRRTVLLATDAAGEGLNLHHSCRTVINLELPWNPMRLEQRIGRVDRIGQRRTVHAFHLIARGTGEMRILDRLRARIRRAQAEAGSPDPLGDAERAIARLVIDNAETTSSDERLDSISIGAGLPSVGLERQAAAEAVRLAAARSIDTNQDAEAGPMVETDGPWIAITRNRSTRANAGSRLVLLLRAALHDACGRIVESTIVAIAVSLKRLPLRRRDRSWIADVLRSAGPEVAILADGASEEWREEALRLNRAFAAIRLERERAIAAVVAGDPPGALQPGLFDRRADNARLTALALRNEAQKEAAERIGAVERTTAISAQPPKLLLVLVP